jgi:molybdate transport system ATP-binding protein
MIVLGGEVVVWLRPEGVPAARLQMRLPERAVRRFAVAAGQSITVCLRAADVIPLGIQPD